MGFSFLSKHVQRPGLLLGLWNRGTGDTRMWEMHDQHGCMDVVDMGIWGPHGRASDQPALPWDSQAPA